MVAVGVAEERSASTICAAVKIGTSGAQDRGGAGGERSRGAGSHRLNVLCVAEVEAAEALAVLRKAVDRVRQAAGTGAHDPASLGCGLRRGRTFGVAAAGSGDGVERGVVVGVVGARDGTGGAGGSGSEILRAVRVGGGGDGEHTA